LLLGDVHLSDRPPSSCTDSYTGDLFGLLAQAAEFAVHCQVVVIAGDLFHIKAPSRNSLALVLRTIKALREFPCDVLVVPGNHDMLFDRLDSVFAHQPLGLVFEAGAAHLLNGWGSPFPIFGVPWLQHWTDEAVWEALRPYREMREHNPSRQPYLIVTHAPLYPEGQELPYEHYPARKWYEAMGREGQVFYGHVHEPHGQYGFYDAEGGVTFCNNGALSRGSLHEHNLERQVGVTFWDSETGAFEFVPLRSRPAAEVFRLAEAQQVTDMAGRLDAFLEGIASTQLGVVSTESVLAAIREMDGVGPAELTLAQELLQEAQHGN
jgi:hypothetical protein